MNKTDSDREYDTAIAKELRKQWQEREHLQRYVTHLEALAYCWTCGELLGLGDHTACRGNI